jgi:hypothetical protein
MMEQLFTPGTANKESYLSSHWQLAWAQHSKIPGAKSKTWTRRTRVELNIEFRTRYLVEVSG